MRYIIESNNKKKLFSLLKERHKCKNIKALSKKMNISFKTLQGWFYDEKKTIPDHIFDRNLLKKIKIKEKKNDNWGQIKGGKMAYFLNLKRKQSLGGINAARIKEEKELANFNINLEDPKFLEFYGILLGDGWLSNFKSGGKTFWIIGICTNLSLEKEFVIYYKRLVKNLFDRNGWLRHREKNNVSEFMFSHKVLLKYLNQNLNFPIGKKENLKIHQTLIDLGFDNIKYIIRGIFDTDGSFYLDKNRKGKSNYPVISIHMNEPILIKQISSILEKEGFRVIHSDKFNMLKIKGKDQLKIWLKKIGSSNEYKLNKMLASIDT